MVETKLQCITEKVRKDSGCRFTSLFHLDESRDVVRVFPVKKGATPLRDDSLIKTYNPN